MSALSVIGANLISPSMLPLTLRTGAKSKPDPNAGATSNKLPSTLSNPITTADKAGAAILTILAVFVIVGGAWWLIV